MPLKPWRWERGVRGEAQTIFHQLDPLFRLSGGAADPAGRSGGSSRGFARRQTVSDTWTVLLGESGDARLRLVWPAAIPPLTHLSVLSRERALWGPSVPETPI